MGNVFKYYVKPFGCYFNRVLPAVYEDSLSYLEQLCKLKYKLNEVITNITQLESGLPDYIKQTIDATLGGWEEEMNQRFTEQNEKIDSALQEVKEVTEEMQTQVDTAIRQMEATINQQLNTLYLILTNGINANKAYIDAQIALLKEEFPDLSNVFVISPVDGQLVTIQKCVNDMMNTLRYGALTAAQYDALQLTAEAYDGKNLTAFQYDMYGLCELWSYLDVHRMHSMSTGEIVAIPAAVYQLANYVRENAASAQAYDNAEYTAETYDGLSITAYNYDWQGVS